MLLLQVGSGFKTKGLDRSLKALAGLPEALRARTRLIVIGQDDPAPFLRQARSLGIAERVAILPGRSDIPRFLLGADLLIHPAYNENTGTVLLEALVAGLPVLATAVCGYAHYIEEAEGGRVVAEPFVQETLTAVLEQMQQAIQTQQKARMNGKNMQLQHAAALAASLDPYRVLARGYALVTDAKGKVCTVEQLQPEQTICVRSRQYQARCRVETVEEINESTQKL